MCLQCTAVSPLTAHLLEGHHFQEGLGEDGRPEFVCCGRGREEHPPTGIKGELVVNNNLPPAPLKTVAHVLVIFMHIGTL